MREGGIGLAAESLPSPADHQRPDQAARAGAGRPLPAGAASCRRTRHTVFEYADQLFTLGRTSSASCREPHRGNAARDGWRVGRGAEPGDLAGHCAPDAGRDPYRVVFHTGSLHTLVAELAAGHLDLVLSSSALPANAGLRAFSHFLGECDVTFFAAPALARRLRGSFPRSLDQAPFLLPTDRSPNRRVLDTWFLQEGITPRIVGEFDDSALAKAFVQGGAGVFAAPSAIEGEIIRQYKVRVVGRTATMHARFYLLSMERQIRHPAVRAIMERAREGLFSALAGIDGSA